MLQRQPAHAEGFGVLRVQLDGSALELPTRPIDASFDEHDGQNVPIAPEYWNEKAQAWAGPRTKRRQERGMKKMNNVVRSILSLFGISLLAGSLTSCGIEDGTPKDATDFTQKVNKALSNELPTVVIVTTGGTIAEKADPKTGGAVPALSGEELLKAVPDIAELANIKLVNYSNIDSSQMTPKLWAGLSRVVDKQLEDPLIKGAVITHGTDTIAEGAYFLDLTLKSTKPVVFVGAMRDASDLSPDGPANIFNAVVQVCSDEARNWGVTVTLNQYINSARDVRKTNSTNVQTFNSAEKGYLGCIAMGTVIRLNDRLDHQRIPLPDDLPKVILLETFAGDDGSFVRYAVDQGAKGIVIEGVGAGNVNQEVYKAVEYALNKKVAVVITTRVYHGGVFPIYGDQGGGETLEKAGVILGGDLTGPKARILLMLALPQVKGNHARLTEYFKY